MNRAERVTQLREDLGRGRPSIGSWMQIGCSSAAEIMGRAGYDWVAVDMEHGSISAHQLPDIFRALELGGTLPLVRLAQGKEKDCKQALDAGAGGVIVPSVKSAEHLMWVRDACRWPPAGRRGVGFSRANLFGKAFEEYQVEAQAPFLVAMIEDIDAAGNIDAILAVEGLDAILIGPYDLSASMGITGRFAEINFQEEVNRILRRCQEGHIACGVHVVMPDAEDLEKRIQAGYRFIAYGLDAVFLNVSAEAPKVM